MNIHSPLWTPLRIGPTTVKHRVMTTAHALYYAQDNVFTDRHVAYYAERAKGGVALQITSGHAAHRLSKGTFTIGTAAWDTRSIPQYERLADAVHAHDSRLFVQLFAPGVRDRGTETIDTFHELWGPSRVPSVIDNELPVAMEQWQIDDVVQGFAASARNVQVAGLDGVEIHAAHSSSLVGHFLSPAYNKRTDAYGGSAPNRCRLAIEIGRAVRERTGGELAVGIRISFDEFMGPAGITPDDAGELVEELAASAAFDFFNISGGSYNTLHFGVPSMTVAEGFLVPLARQAKAIVGDRGTVFVVGRIRELDHAARVIEEGSADMVAMTRAHIADPHLVRKALEGRSRAQVRCVGVNECVGRIVDGREMVCMINPSTGRERQWGEGTLRAASTRRRVVVVGGGLAGMKVAAVAGSRGHDVVLLEQTEELGGHLNVLKRLPTRAGWQDAIDDLGRALEDAGVDVRLGVEAGVELLAAERPDVVVCATGSTYDRTGFTPFRSERDGIPGAEQEHVLPVDVATAHALADPTCLGKRLLIVDEAGSYLPLGLAEVCAAAGASVELITRNLVVGEQVLRTLEAGHLFPRLAAHGVRLTAQTFVERIGATDVELYVIWGGSRRMAAVDTVVLSMLRSPCDELYLAARERFPEVHRIGDALAPRTPTMAVFEGEKLGRTL